jgi:hypothetical protein
VEFDGFILVRRKEGKGGRKEKDNAEAQRKRRGRLGIRRGKNPTRNDGVWGTRGTPGFAEGMAVH